MLIGSTAASLADFRATPTERLFPGVEVHASIISSLLDNQFYAKPEWTRGLCFSLIVATGIILSLLLPLLSAPMQVITTLVFGLCIWLTDDWLWRERRFVIDAVVPILTIMSIGGLNILWAFLLGNRDRQQLKAMFGQYVPPQLVDEMSRRPGEFAMEGERREMSVLFADIRNFTSISEQLTATELKSWLNTYFTPITEVLFQHHGTIDK